MRYYAIAATLAFSMCAGVIEAADVAFDCDETLFESPAPSDDDFRQFAATKNDEDDFLRRLSIRAILNFPTYDSPLYEGLWPMTISAFRSHDDNDNRIEMEFEFELPEPQKADAFLLASNDIHSLRGSLWNVTRKELEKKEMVWPGFSR